MSPSAFHQTPTPGSLVDDLERIVHDLARWKALPLLAATGLPSVHLSLPVLETGASSVRESAGQDERVLRTHRNTLLEQRISDAIARVVLADERRALTDLFAFDDPSLSIKDRQTAAALKLDVKYDSFRHTGERKLLRVLADEMFRGELSWSASEIEKSRAEVGLASLNRWCEELELHRSVALDEADPRHQTWHFRCVLRCVRPEIPLYVQPQYWTGSGTPETLDTVRVLSGQDERSPIELRHRLLNIRPASNSTTAYSLYVWDLGGLKRVGAEEDVEFEQSLTDLAGTFQPFIGFSTETRPHLRRICMGVKAPEAERAYLKRLKLLRDTALGTYGSPVLTEVGEPIDVARAESGYFIADVTEVEHGLSYELHWE